MSWIAEKAAFRCDNTVALCIYDTRHRFGLLGSGLVETQRLYVLFWFALLCLTLI